MLLPRDLQKRVNSGGICVSRDEQEMSLPNPFRSEFVPVVFKVEANSNLLQITFNTPTTIHLTVNLFASALHQRISIPATLLLDAPVGLVQWQNQAQIRQHHHLPHPRDPKQIQKKVERRRFLVLGE
jgi:hypothetical protein